MSLAAFLDAPAIVQVHSLAAFAAMGLGPGAILRRRRDRLHKLLGYGFVAAMALTAISAAFISALRWIGPFSIIHLLIPVVLVGLWRGVAQARAGQIAAHRQQMVALYWQGIGVAGVFTFLPGRLMNEIAFGGGSWPGFAGVALVAGGALIWLTRSTPVRTA